MAITKRERKRLGKLLKRSVRRPGAVDGEREAWVRQKIAEMQAEQNAAWERQTVVPSKSMQFRLDRAARDMRQRVERGEGTFDLRLLDVRFWDFRMAFDGVDPDAGVRRQESGVRRNTTAYDWWLSLDPHTRHLLLLEMVRLEVGETTVTYRPKRKCPYCGKVVRVVDRGREEWPFLVRHRRRRGPSTGQRGEDCAGSFYVIDDLVDVSVGR